MPQYPHPVPHSGCQRCSFEMRRHQTAFLHHGMLDTLSQFFEFWICWKQFYVYYIYVYLLSSFLGIQIYLHVKLHASSVHIVFMLCTHHISYVFIQDGAPPVISWSISHFYLYVLMNLHHLPELRGIPNRHPNCIPNM